jgi:hypothetical protein
MALELLVGPGRRRSMAGVPADVLEQIRVLRSGGGRAYAAAWREHESELRDFATVHRIKRPGDSKFYFAEACAARVGGSVAQLRRAAAEQDARTSCAVAHHEAAHAVSWLEAGIPVARVSVFDTGGGLAVARAAALEAADVELLRKESRDVGPVLELPDGWPLGGHLVALEAGAVAYARVTGRPAEARDTGWYDRLATEQHLARVLGVPPYSALVRDATALIQQHAEQLCSRHWTWITRAADALQAQGTLSGAEIAALRPTPTKGPTNAHR